MSLEKLDGELEDVSPLATSENSISTVEKHLIDKILEEADKVEYGIPWHW